jgi:hypothetical protein
MSHIVEKQSSFFFAKVRQRLMKTQQRHIELLSRITEATRQVYGEKSRGHL